PAPDATPPPAVAVQPTAPAPDAAVAATEPAPPEPDISPVERLLEAAAEDLAALRLTTPADDNAYDKYQQVLALEPDNDRAQRGLEAIAARYVELTYRGITTGQLEKAAGYLDKARDISPAHPAIADAGIALAAARSSSPDPGQVSYEDRADVMGRAFGAFVEEQQAAPAPEPRSRGDQFLQRFGN
ncbi:MAG: hypothetical protein ACU85V_17605, partial [Gammaproteobacteria bacterium]